MRPVIYLAARYSRRLELCTYRNDLREVGFEVRARWLNGEHQISDKGIPIGEHGESLVEDGSTDCAAKLRAHFANDDWEDVTGAGLVISFTEAPRATNSSRGGRHVEFGIALGRGTPVWIVGTRENIFHWLPSVVQFDSWKECLDEILTSFPHATNL